MGDKHVTTMGNIHVTTMGEYTRDHHTRDTSQFIVGKTYLSRVLYTERCLLFIQITCTDDAYSDRLVQFTFYLLTSSNSVNLIEMCDKFVAGAFLL